MARYIIEEMPDLQQTGKRITYPKFARIDNTSIKELAQCLFPWRHQIRSIR